jgi:hypothetical protein
MSISRAELDELESVVDELAPLLAGRSPEKQGAILAMATARWLAGHRSLDRETTEAIRKALLAMHVEAVGVLVEIEDAEFLAKRLRH